MKHNLPLLALVILSAFTSSLAAHAPFHTSYAASVFNAHVAPVKSYSMLSRMSALTTAAPPAADAEPASKQVPVFEHYVLYTIVILVIGWIMYDNYLQHRPRLVKSNAPAPTGAADLVWQNLIAFNKALKKVEAFKKATTSSPEDNQEVLKNLAVLKKAFQKLEQLQNAEALNEVYNALQAATAKSTTKAKATIKVDQEVLQNLAAFKEARKNLESSSIQRSKKELSRNPSSHG